MSVPATRTSLELWMIIRCEHASFKLSANKVLQKEILGKDVYQMRAKPSFKQYSFPATRKALALELCDYYGR